MPVLPGEYTPPSTWYTLQHLSLGDWLDITDYRAWSLQDAQIEANTRARANLTSYRVVEHTAGE